jgi:hypothetical protein
MTVMKRLLATILLVVYAVMSTGFVVSLHYCMDRLNSAQLGETTSDKCDRCGMHKEGHCCWDDVKIVKVQTSHLTPKTTIEIPSLAPEIVTPFNYVIVSFPVTDRVKYPLAHGPPINKQDTYLTNCVFRI